ncbi:hypothetical protein EsDP_00002492 [Epichloe bromicola]|uniref:Ribosomal protein S21 n=1 Tax=Epichloe bromicola TaxID=79588 RepID=A0ABQ0CLG2_9HYPO
MLGRMAMASRTRALSTVIPLRIAPSRDNPSRPARSNPLVGNYVPAEPAQPREREGAEVPPPPPPPPSKSAGEDTEQQQPLFAYDAVDARPLIDIANIISDKSAAYGRVYGISNPLDRPRVRAKAVAGRTVFIKDRLTPRSAPTPMVALRVLDKMCRDQKIKNKFHSQKFHERKGLKKKRLRSQRWRARFKTGFRAAVRRVAELKRQGW